MIRALLANFVERCGVALVRLAEVLRRHVRVRTSVGNAWPSRRATLIEPATTRAAERELKRINARGPGHMAGWS